MDSFIIESERLYLKEFTFNDIDDYFHLNSDPDVMKYIGREPETDINVIKENIKKIRKYYIENPGLGTWAGFEKESEKFIGFYELAHLDNTDKIEVGYRLLKEFWRLGYATEMTKVLIDYGFNKMGLDKIVGITNPDNSASQKVLKKSGLRYVKEAFYYDTNVNYYVVDRIKYKMNGNHI